MNEEIKDVISDMIEKMTETLEKAKKVAEFHGKLSALLSDCDFDERMSILSMSLARTIMDEADDFGDALAYAARLSHTLITVIDNHAEKEWGNEEEEEKAEGTLQ